MIELNTVRLVLTPATRADASALHALWSSAGARRFLWDDEAIPLARTEAVIATSEQLFERRRHGLWCVRTRRSHELIGFGGLWPFREPPEFELLYGVAEDRWGRGYAGEIARAVLAYCFDALAMPRVRASTDVANAASVRVLEKLGAVLVEQRIVGGLDTAFYEVARDAVAHG
jgi:RimJ/RimL family protein N-acetyltransferase